MSELDDHTSAAMTVESLREAFDSLQLAVRSAQIGLWDWDLATNEVKYSPEWKGMLGYSVEEISDHFDEWERLVHPDDVESAKQRVQAYLDNPWPQYENEFRMLHRDGTYRWILARAAVLRNSDGEPVRMLGSHMDITQRKNLENALSHRAEFERIVGAISSEFVRLAPDEIDAGIRRSLRLLGEFTGADRAYVFLVRADGEHVDNTHEWCSDGITPQMEHLQDLRIQADYPWFTARIQQFEPVYIPDVAALPDEAALDRKHWQEQDIRSLVVVPMIRGNELAGFLGFDAVSAHRDWTKDDATILRLVGEAFVHALARREVTAALRQSEQQFRSLIEGQTDLIVRWKPGPKHLFVNDRYCEYFNLDRNAVAGINFLSLIHPDDRQMIIDKVAGLSPDNPVAEDEHRVVKPDGTYAWQWWVDRAFFDDAGNPVEYLSVGRDVTERVEAEAALRESEQRYRDVVETQTEMICRWTPDGKLTFVNEAYCRYFEESAEALLGTRFAPKIPDEDQKAAADVFKALTPDQNEVYVEHRVTLLDGRTAWLGWTTRATFDDHGRVVEYQGVGRDITQRREAEAARERAEAELRQAQKMEVVGRLAGGVAHDFNNMLSVILGYSEQLAKKIPKGESYYEDVLQIRDAARRSADLTSQLLAFSRKQVITPIVIDLNEAIDKQHRMLERLIGENITWTIEPGNALWSVRIDPAQFSQLLANLCVNARDAIAEHGAITIATRNIAIDAAESERRGYIKPGEYVQLSVSDNGIGMDEETLTHVFEPFFTTKDAEKGTGLGLATVYGAVKQNGGFIHVTSAPGEGSTFDIYLPRHKGKVTISPIVKTPAPGIADATILVVEDEPMLLTLAQRALEGDGYHVLAAASPAEACRLAQEHRDEIDLLLTDIVMPEMNGKELKAAIETIKPGVRTVYMSGYTADIVEDQGITADGTVLLQKPFTIATLRNAVQNALLE